jgi:fatty-acyl-CoA synthase
MSADRPLDVSYYPADTSVPLLRLTLGQLLCQIAEEVPERIALVDGSAPLPERRRWTYRELYDTCERMARALLGHFRPGDRIALCAPNCPEWIFIQHSLHLAGLVLVPLNPAYRTFEIATILRDAGAAGFFHVDRFRNNNIAEIVPELRETCPSLRATVLLSELEDFLGDGDPATELPEAAPEDTLFVQYTSGTTGIPKGARLHHLGVINTARYLALRAGFPEGGVWLNAMPMFHVGGSVNSGVGTIARRGTMVIMPGFDAGQMLELIEQERANTTLVVPTMIYALMEHPDLPRRDLRSLVTLLSGASEVPASLVQRAKSTFNCGLSILYGQTEANGTVSQTSPEDSVEDQAETLGRPLPNSEVAILDSVTGEIQPIGVTGEICVRGYQVMVGYFGQEQATQDCVDKEGWLHSGDMGTIDSRGYLRIAGRSKEMIIRGGINLYPREIEEVLLSHPAVAQVSVVGVPDEKWGELVAAAVILAEPTLQSPWLELHTYCRDRLAAHKTPALWFVVQELPLTPTGKIQKFVLRNRIAQGDLMPVEWERPVSQRPSR